MIPTVKIVVGDCLVELGKMEAQSVHCCVTSPPYWGLRDYGVEGQLGLEKTPQDYVTNMVAVFREVRRVLRDDGTVWLNLGDSYACTPVGKFNGGGDCVTGRDLSGHESGSKRNKLTDSGLKPKDLVGIPWRVAFALQEDGWYLRQDIIWHKPNPMPESVTDRCTKAHEYIFLLSKSQRYYYDADAIKEPASPDNTVRDRDSTRLNNTPGRTKMNGLTTNGYENRNKRSVWTVTTQPYSEAHFATYPPDLIKPCILAGCSVGGTVLDPFGGSGTTGMVACELGRNAVLIELNPEYAALAERRTNVTPGLALV